MSEQRGGEAPSYLLLDIEGTTTPISFVHEELYSYARTRLDSFLSAHWNEPRVTEVLKDLDLEHEAETPDAPALHGGSADEHRTSAVRYLEWLMDRDRKSPALKTIQGWIWDEGYLRSELHGRVWPDVPQAMKRWTDAGRRVAIYSSGSQLAQRRLFQSTEYGDLSPMISAFFDTSIGHKRASESYQRIARELRTTPDNVLFVSDVTAELAAAREAGMQVVLAVRPGNQVQEDMEKFRTIESLEEIV